MRAITFLQPKRLTFGSGCLADCFEYLAARAETRIHIVSSPSFAARASQIAEALRENGRTVTIDSSTASEPTLAMFHKAVGMAREARAECVLGIGGGSALDQAKLVAAFVRNEQRVEDAFGIGLLSGRDCHLVCMPTTAGTGSEVSPNAILLDEEAHLKKGVISPWLVPDAAFIDPDFTMSVPAAVTAATGLDALTHCVEAYTNKFAHPLVDVYALKGIELCSQHLVKAVHAGDDREAREGMALVSLYGGLCLGPVNTAAVHALAYPLGGEYHVPHGLSNAVLLPAVFRFNAKASPGRHADVARALGVSAAGDDLTIAHRGAERLKEMAAACGVNGSLASYGVSLDAVPSLAAAALTVTRLLKNNPRKITMAAAEQIYRECLTQS